MKKIIAFALLISLLLFTFTSCGPLFNFGYIDYIFIDDVDNIEKIELVKVTEIFSRDEDDSIIVNCKMDILATVPDIDEFLENLSYLTCVTLHFLRPMIIGEDEYGIKITYKSGHFEVIGAMGQTYYIDGVFSATDKYQYFDEDEFNAFVESYISSIRNSGI